MIWRVSLASSPARARPLNPVLSIAIAPNSEADRDPLAHGLHRLMAEDATLRVDIDPAGHAVVGGMGELHLEVVVHRLQHEFHVGATYGPPQVAYKEVLLRAVDGEMVPVRLEPVMLVKVVGPAEYAAVMTAGLAERSGEIQSEEDDGATKTIHARVPMSAMLGYAEYLRSCTEGRATYSLNFDRYEPV
jgi:translation elongation factor EF-G